MVGADRYLYPGFGKQSRIGSGEIGKFRLASGSKQRTGDYRSAFLCKFLSNQMAFGSMNQNIVQLKVLGDTDRCENIISAMAVEMSLLCKGAVLPRFVFIFTGV